MPVDGGCHDHRQGGDRFGGEPGNLDAGGLASEVDVRDEQVDLGMLAQERDGVLALGEGVDGAVGQFLQQVDQQHLHDGVIFDENDMAGSGHSRIRLAGWTVKAPRGRCSARETFCTILHFCTDSPVGAVLPH